MAVLPRTGLTATGWAQTTTLFTYAGHRGNCGIHIWNTNWCDMQAKLGDCFLKWECEHACLAVYVILAPSTTTVGVLWRGPFFWEAAPEQSAFSFTSLADLENLDKGLGSRSRRRGQPNVALKCLWHCPNNHSHNWLKSITEPLNKHCELYFSRQATYRCFRGVAVMLLS